MLGWSSLIAACNAAGQNTFVLTAVPLGILRFDGNLARRSRGTDLDLECSVSGDDRLAATAAYRRSGFGASANQIKISTQEFRRQTRDGYLRASAACRDDKLERITPVARLATRRSCSNAREVNTRPHVTGGKLSRNQLIVFNHSSVPNEKRQCRNVDAPLSRCTCLRALPFQCHVRGAISSSYQSLLIARRCRCRNVEQALRSLNPSG